MVGAADFRRICAAALVLGAIAPTVTSAALAAPCSFEPQGEGRVSAIIDARTFRMEDGREVRLAGIETVTDGAAALGALVAGRSVTLHGETDAPDRYGRQPAFVFVEQAAASVQNQLLTQGDALVSSMVADKACAADPRCRRGDRPAGPPRDLGRSGGHKKRGKSGRYSGQDRAVHRGRGEGSIGAAGRSNNLRQFRPALDTRLSR